MAMSTKSQQLQIRVTPAQKAALKRRAREAHQDVSSYVLDRLLPPSRDRFEGVLDSLRREKPDGTRFGLAELNDVLVALTPSELVEAVAQADLCGLSEFLANYVAAMVEQASSVAGVCAPAWTREVPPLDEPYFAAPLRSLRPHLLKESPVPFKRRNLFVDSSLGDRV